MPGCTSNESPYVGLKQNRCRCLGEFKLRFHIVKVENNSTRSLYGSDLNYKKVWVWESSN